MSFDRGFVKWQPFNAVLSGKVLGNNKMPKIKMPTLFPEEIENINAMIREAYYAKEKVLIWFYEAGQIKRLEAYITRLNFNNETLVLNQNKVIAFKQIYKIKEL